jgi:hypothetical protein
MEIDKNKLYSRYGMARWGLEQPDGSIILEEVYKNGGRFLKTVIPASARLIPIFSVEEKGRYPTKDEWTTWINEGIR